MLQQAQEVVSKIILSDRSLFPKLCELQEVPFELDPVFEENPTFSADLFTQIDTVMTSALQEGQPDALLDFHRTLDRCLQLRMSCLRNRQELSYHLYGFTMRMAKAWLNRELTRVDLGQVHGNKSPEVFKEWFLQTLAEHPATDHPLYTYLENKADRAGFAFFVIQEQTVDAGFADLIAMTQVGALSGAKLEMAENLWDEVGAGNPKKAHAALFHQARSFLDIVDVEEADLSWAALACGNLFNILAMHRFYHFSSIGCLAATEMAVAKRFERLVRGAERLSLSKHVIEYYLEHVLSDTKHATGWLENVCLPAISSHVEAASDMAKGILLRLNTSKAYCDCILDRLHTRASAI